MGDRFGLVIDSIITLMSIALITIGIFLLYTALYTPQAQTPETPVSGPCAWLPLETRQAFRVHIPCYWNESYANGSSELFPGECSDVSEMRNESISAAACTCVSGNKSRGVYYWATPDTYPPDVYFNYSIARCVNGSKALKIEVGPITEDLNAMLGNSTSGLERKPCIWGGHESCYAESDNLP